MFEPLRKARRAGHVESGRRHCLALRGAFNTWLRFYERDQRPPAIGDYEPTRLTEELTDLIYIPSILCNNRCG